MAILRAAAAVYEITGKLKPDYRVGGDDFIDIWVFCVLHAKIPNLARFYLFFVCYFHILTLQNDQQCSIHFEFWQ